MKKLIAAIIAMIMAFSLALPAAALQSVPIKGIKLDKATLAVKTNETYTLRIVYSPSNTTQKMVSFSTSNASVAGVDKYGKISAVGAGSAVITVSSASNKKIMAKCTVTVTKVNLPEYTVKILVPGGPFNELDKIQAEVAKKLKSTLNIKLNITALGWDNPGNKMLLKSKAGESFDLVFAASWCNYDALRDNKYLKPLNDLLPKYGQNILKSVPQAIWECNDDNGVRYRIPNFSTITDLYSFAVRKDLREKYGLGPIKTLDQLEAYMAKVKQNEPDIAPIAWQGLSTVPIAGIYPAGIKDFLFRVGSCYVPVYEDANGLKPIVGLLEDPMYLNAVKTIYKWQTNGWVSKNIITIQDQGNEFAIGKAAVVGSDKNSIASIITKLAQNVPGAKAELVCLVSNGGKLVSDFKMNNGIALSTNSKDPVRAIQFLDWIYAAQANYDLLGYGVKGINWEDLGNNTYTIPSIVDANKNYNLFHWAVMEKPGFEKISADFPPEAIAQIKFTSDSKNFIKSKLAGFNFEVKPVENEFAKVNAIWDAIMQPIANGLVNPDTAVPDAIKKLNDAGYNKIVDECKKQVNQFVSKK